MLREYLAYLKARNLEKKKQWTAAAKLYAESFRAGGKKKPELAYRAGFAYTKSKKWKEALPLLKVAATDARAKPNWCFRYALTLESLGKQAAALPYYDQALAADPEHAEWHYWRSRCLLALKRKPEAEEAISQALQLAPDNLKYRRQFATVLNKIGRTWQELDVLESLAGVNEAKGDKSLLQARAEAADKMNRFTEAAQAFSELATLEPANAMWAYREGYAWERADEPGKAQAAYERARSLGKNLKAPEFGIGVFHQSRSLWPQAAEAYAQEVKKQPLNAELHYRLGMAHDRCYRWAQAADCYRRAVMIEATHPEWHYRLGFVLERQSLWEQAADAYEYAATTRSTHTPYWYYRLGYVLAEAGRDEEACAAFIRTRTQPELDAPQPSELAAVPTQTQRSVSYLQGLKRNFSEYERTQAQSAALHSNDPAAAFYKLGNQAERMEMWDEAASAYRKAIDRLDTHNRLWQYRLGYVLSMANRFDEAVKEFKKTRIFQRPDSFDISKLPDSDKLRMIYAEFYDTLHIKDNVVMYESFHGASIGCNPYAIYEELCNLTESGKFKHVFVINDKTKIPEYLKKENVIFVSRGSIKYLEYLASAKYLINNNTFPDYFIRKSGQKYLNTWHGTPVKTLGKDIKNGSMDHKNATRNFLQVTHLIAPNKYTLDILLDKYEVRKIYNGYIGTIGYPRVDRTLKCSEEKKKYIKKRLNAKQGPIILYAPTWRGDLKHPIVDIEPILSVLNALKCPKWNIYFRGHHMVEKYIKSDVINGNIAVPEDIDTNDLLGVADVLISDYSSIFFDFYALNKPVIYYVYDYEEYKNRRGLYLDISDLPGEVCVTADDVRKAADKIFAKNENQLSAIYPGKYEEAFTKYVAQNDGNSAKRIVDVFFKDRIDQYPENFSKNVAEKNNILFYAGRFIPNGITKSLLKVTDYLEKNERKNCQIVIEPELIFNDKDRAACISRLNENVGLIAQVGAMLTRPEEKLIAGLYKKQYHFDSMEQENILNRAYDREFKRLFGCAEFSSIIDFEGYVGYWANLFGRSRVKSNKVIYLHNDMVAESQLRFPYLHGIFNTYKYFSKLVSVSSSVNEINKLGLAEKYELKGDKFITCGNLIDRDEIEKKSQEDIPESLSVWLKNASHVFVTIGRLSPEKNHQFLINAFARLVHRHSNEKLVIVGGGPLFQKLNLQIKELGLENNVILTGLLLNPYRVLKAADCFLFASKYEGQGIVVLEAISLDKPVIACDVVGPRSILQAGGGVLVNSDENDFLDALEKFVLHGYQFRKFDLENYIKNIEKIIESEIAK